MLFIDMKLLSEKLLKEWLLNEATVSTHIVARIHERLSKIGSEDISPVIIKHVNDSINKIKKTNFDPNESYAIRVGHFKGKVNPESKFYKQYEGRGDYYAFKSVNINEENDTYSIGDEFWAIIRGNNMITFFVRMHHQNRDKLRVDNVYDDFLGYERDNVKPDNTPKRKYKKMKLATGDDVLWFKLTKDFEDLLGNTLEFDDIFGMLSSKDQERVYKELDENKKSIKALLREKLKFI